MQGEQHLPRNNSDLDPVHRKSAEKPEKSPESMSHDRDRDKRGAQDPDRLEEETKIDLIKNLSEHREKEQECAQDPEKEPDADGMISRGKQRKTECAQDPDKSRDRDKDRREEPEAKIEEQSKNVHRNQRKR